MIKTKSKGDVLMRITFEEDGAHSLIYIYLHEIKTENDTDSINAVKGNIFLDEENNWIGIELLNLRGDDEEIELPYMESSADLREYKTLFHSKEKIVILFDENRKVAAKKEEYFNLDVDAENELVGIELITIDFPGKLKLADRFITKHIVVKYDW